MRTQHCRCDCAVVSTGNCVVMASVAILVVVLLPFQLEALGVIPLASLLRAAKENASPKARLIRLTVWYSANVSSQCPDVWTGAAVPAVLC
jgi:hypothetical protein